MHRLGLRFGESARNVVDHALKRPLKYPAAIGAFIVDGEIFLARAIQDGVHCLFGQLAHRVIQGEFILFRQRLEIHPGDGVVFDVVEAGCLNRTLQNGLRIVRDDERRIGHQLRAESAAHRARTIGVVEREHAWAEFGQRHAAVLAGVVLREHGVRIAFEQVEDHKSAREVRRRLN